MINLLHITIFDTLIASCVCDFSIIH